MSILIIEPARVYQQLLADMLASHAIDYHIVENGKAALQYTGNVEVICTARQLPDMLGSEFCLRYRKQAADTALPILMWSADIDSEVQKEAKRSGITAMFARNQIDELFANILQHYHAGKSGQQRKVLFIEDSVTMAMIMRAQLEKSGFNVTHLTNGEQATETLLQARFDLLLTDIILEGGMSGLDILKFVRQQAAPLKHLPVIAATGVEDPQVLDQMWQAGLDGLVKKPLDAEEFARLVAKLLPAG